MGKLKMNLTKLSEIIMRSVKLSEEAHKFGNVIYKNQLTSEAREKLKEYQREFSRIGSKCRSNSH